MANVIQADFKKHRAARWLIGVYMEAGITEDVLEDEQECFNRLTDFFEKKICKPEPVFVGRDCDCGQTVRCDCDLP